jgi:hypothetical protein
MAAPSVKCAARPISRRIRRVRLAAQAISAVAAELRVRDSGGGRVAPPAPPASSVAHGVTHDAQAISLVARRRPAGSGLLSIPACPAHPAGLAILPVPPL